MHFHNREKVIEIERTEITSVNPGKENIIYLYPSEIKGNASRPISCNDISIRDEIIEFFHQSLSGTRMCFHFYSPNYIDLILWFKAFGRKVNIKRTVSLMYWVKGVCLLVPRGARLTAFLCQRSHLIALLSPITCQRQLLYLHLDFVFVFVFVQMSAVSLCL